jgi:hypothetical protein
VGPLEWEFGDATRVGFVEAWRMGKCTYPWLTVAAPFEEAIVEAIRDDALCGSRVWLDGDDLANRPRQHLPGGQTPSE